MDPGAVSYSGGGTFCFSLKEGSTVNIFQMLFILAVISVVSVGAQSAVKSKFPSAGLPPTSCVGRRVVRCLSASRPVHPRLTTWESPNREHWFSWPEGD